MAPSTPRGRRDRGEGAGARPRLLPLGGTLVHIPVPKCSLSKYGFRASGVRTRASTGRAETGHLSRFLSSVLKRPSQEVRRERASGERFSAVSAPGQSAGMPRKPRETCHSARRSVWRRAWLLWELAERVGFEPTVQLPVLRFSRPTRSTAPAPLHGVPGYNAKPRWKQRPLCGEGERNPLGFRPSSAVDARPRPRL